MTKLTHSYSSIKMYMNCPLRYYHQRVRKAVTDPGSEATHHGERIHKFLEDRLKTNTELPQEAAHYEPLTTAIINSLGEGELLVEQELTLNVELKPTGWFDEDAWLRTKIDVLVVNQKQAKVLDWKTGKRKPDFDQLELYALQIFTHYPEVERVAVGFVWLKDKAMDREVYMRQDAAALWEKLLTQIKRIEKSMETEVWPARPSGLCRFCPARHLCDYAQ
jgi:CRISPR/Cas system-associated exonuclease Cas4 (RecB family)